MTWFVQVPIADLRLDTGPQVRVTLDAELVAAYAERMAAGDVFPPVRVFADGGTGGTLHLADGYHRCRAAEKCGLSTIAAEMSHGTRDEAMWCALGANKANGQRLSDRDVRHAIEVALATWPDRSGKQLAEQIGCSQRYVAAIRDQVRATAILPDRVVGKDGKRYPSRRPPKDEVPLVLHPKRDAVAEMVRAGKQSRDIQAELHIRSEVIADVRRELGVGKVDTSRDAVRKRHLIMKHMASEGYTSRQIAAATGLTGDGARGVMRRLGIVSHADKLLANTHRHDANRIVGKIVADAENLSEGLDLIDFADLDHSQIPDWISTLRHARSILGTFIKRLTQEQFYGQDDVQSQAVQDSSGAHQPDANPDSPGDSTGVP